MVALVLGGSAEGRAEGRVEGINSVIKQMHTKGMSIVRGKGVT